MNIELTEPWQIKEYDHILNAILDEKNAAPINNPIQIVGFNKTAMNIGYEGILWPKIEVLYRTDKGVKCFNWFRLPVGEKKIVNTPNLQKTDNSVKYSYAIFEKEIGRILGR